MVRHAPPDRLAKLVHAAAAAFVEHGFHRTQMDDVAGRLGVSKGTLYRHVDSKESLLAAVLVYGDAPEALPGDGPLEVADLASLAAMVRTKLAGAVAGLELTAAVADAPPSQQEADLGDQVERLALDLHQALARHRTTVMVLDRCAAEIPELAGSWYESGRYTVVDLWATFLVRRAGGGASPVPTEVLARTIVELVVLWAVKMPWDPSPRPYPTDTGPACAAMVRRLVVGASR